MSIFDSIRYYLALVILVTGPGSVLFWFPIHPLATYWRRVGYGWAYLAGYGVFAVAGLLAWVWRRELLAIQFGVHPLVIAAAIVLIVAARLMRRSWHRQLSTRTLFGYSELAPDRHPSRLLTEGAYARVRHPRYLEVLFGYLGYALLSNYLAGYLVSAFLVVGIGLLIPLEERELIERFGPAYEAYRKRVPALVPRMRK